jgi:hypothetical protein
MSDDIKHDIEHDIELYKELGAYERHFNTIQGISRTIASTWLLATIAGIGYVLSNTFSSNIVKYQFDAASIVASAGATGIFLLWLLDVKVYHELLLAVFDESRTLEGRLDLKVRDNMESRSSLRVQWIISLFYGVPMLCLSLVAFGLALNGKPSLNYVCYGLAAIIFGLALFVVNPLLVASYRCVRGGRRNLGSWFHRP